MNTMNKQMHIVCAIVPSLCYRFVSFGEHYLAYRTPAPTLRTSVDVMRLLFCLLMTSAATTTTTTMSTIHIGYSSDMASCSRFEATAYCRIGSVQRNEWMQTTQKQLTHKFQVHHQIQKRGKRNAKKNARAQSGPTHRLSFEFVAQHQNPPSRPTRDDAREHMHEYTPPSSSPLHTLRMKWLQNVDFHFRTKPGSLALVCVKSFTNYIR